jgi:hypothetical protein
MHATYPAYLTPLDLIILIILDICFHNLKRSELKGSVELVNSDTALTGICTHSVFSVVNTSNSMMYLYLENFH